MKTVNLVQFTELLSFAETIDFGWNQAHKILVDDEVPPMYEAKSREYNLEEIKDGMFAWSKDSVKIVTGFMEKNKVTDITIV